MASSTNGVNSIMASNIAGLDNLNGMSTPIDVGQTKTVPKVPEKPDTLLSHGQIQTGLAGAKFMLDVMNAGSQYDTIKGQAALNIMQARNSAADALNRGRQAQMDAQSEGYNAGQESLLNAAAQGQDVNGAGAGKIQSSYEAMGVYNGMREEINSMREALGYELEEINYDYQVDQAGIQYTNSLIGSALNLGASAYYYKNGGK